MANKTDLLLSRFLLVAALTSGLALLFFLLFHDFRFFWSLNTRIDLYLNEKNSSFGAFDPLLDRFLDQRFEVQKTILAHLIHSVVLIFGIFTSFLNNHLLSASFALILTTSLLTNLFLPILFPDHVLICIIVLSVLAWLHFDLSADSARVSHRDHV